MSGPRKLDKISFFLPPSPAERRIRTLPFVLQNVRKMAEQLLKSFFAHSTMNVRSPQRRQQQVFARSSSSPPHSRSENRRLRQKDQKHSKYRLRYHKTRSPFFILQLSCLRRSFFFVVLLEPYIIFLHPHFRHIIF